MKIKTFIISVIIVIIVFLIYIKNVDNKTYLLNLTTTDEYIYDLNNLFIITRKYCKEKIIYIGNYIENPLYKKYIDNKVKVLCEKYKINYIENNNLVIESEILNIISNEW